MREVRDMFSAAVQAVVQGASSEPAVYRDSVLVLSVCPFSWHEERCVMRSGLVYLLDKLCSMRSKKTDIAVNLSAMAWAGFQVLLDRIVQWENGKGEKLNFTYAANMPPMAIVSSAAIIWARRVPRFLSFSPSPPTPPFSFSTWRTMLATSFGSNNYREAMPPYIC